MIIKIYSIFDSKLATYSRPWFALTDNGALREFGDAINETNNSSNQWRSHPEDFSLFRVGEFDDQNGFLLPTNPINLATASSLIRANLPFPSQQIQMDLALNATQKEDSPN